MLCNVCLRCQVSLLGTNALSRPKWEDIILLVRQQTTWSTPFASLAKLGKIGLYESQKLCT